MSLVQPKDSATQGASLARGRKAPEGMKEEWACGCVCVCFGGCGGQGLGKGRVTKPQGNTGNTQHLAATHLGLSWPHLTTRHLRADQGDGLPLRSWATRSILVLCPRWPLTATSLQPSPNSGVYFGVLQNRALGTQMPGTPAQGSHRISSHREHSRKVYGDLLPGFSFSKWSIGTLRVKDIRDPEQSPSSRMAFLKQLPQYGHHLLALPLSPQFKFLSACAELLTPPCPSPRTQVNTGSW